MNNPTESSPRRKKTILYVLHDGGGGTAHTTNDLTREVSSHYNCFILKFGLGHCNLFHIESHTNKLIWSFHFTSEWRVSYDLDHERIEFVSTVIKTIQPDIVHTRTFICSSTSLLQLFKKKTSALLIHFTISISFAPQSN